ncbi:MAG: glycosyl transferase family 1 [Bacteroidetes bacterium]|nr:MAG: glycosyl transferase family 1 [Bacteroidota bacterium]
MACEFIKNRDIILFALKSWDMEIGGSSKKYASVFAKNQNRVLFVNRALDRASLFRNRHDQKTKNRLEGRKDESKRLTKVDENIWVLNPASILESINSIGWTWAYDQLSKLNAKRLAKEINKAARELDFKSPILYIENDFLRGYYMEELIENVDLTIYYIRDQLTTQEYYRKHGLRLEPRLIEKSDVVIANSQQLADYAHKFNPNSFFVGQGVDLELFLERDFPKPKELENIPGPIIGYVGAILSTRLDLEIIRTIALKNPKWSVVMVGPEDNTFAKSDLHQIKNVYFTGRKELKELPGFISHFDVCINPQLKNEMTRGNYPLKVDEYLALGKPVVATHTDAMEMFGDYVYLCENAEDYVVSIEKALSSVNDAALIIKRKSFARSHTWESCVEKLDDALMNLNQVHD